jgi:hypothetical protein
MQSDADKRSKYSIHQWQVKAQMGVKLSAFFDKERLAIWPCRKSHNHYLDRPRIWLGVVSTAHPNKIGKVCFWQRPVDLVRQ